MFEPSSPFAGQPFGMDRPALLAALRARAARPNHAVGNSLPLSAAIDQGLPSGGLARAAVHEVVAAGNSAATGFCALLLARAVGGGNGSVVWIAGPAAPLPSGLGRFGLSPADLVLVRVPGPAEGLWAMEEALRSPGIAGALLALDEPDAAAAHRLQLAAEAGGGIGLLLCPDTEATDTSAASRWRVGTLAGAGSQAHALGDPRWQLDLLRCRGGQPGSWQVVWRAAAERLEIDGGDEAPPEEAFAPPPAIRQPRRPR